MRPVLLLLIVFSTLSAAWAQAPRKNAVFWSGDKHCGIAPASVTPDALPECSTVQTPRGPVSVVKHNEISLSVAFLEEDGYILIAAQIDNNSNSPVDVDTDHWGAAHFSALEDLRTGKRPILAETSIPSRDIVRGIKSGVTLDNSADTFMAGISKSMETREVRRNDGTRVRQSVMVDDVEAQQIAVSKKASRSELASAEQERIRRTAITQKWIPAKDKMKGLVYFRRVRKAGVVVFSLKVLDTSYVFRLLRKNAGSKRTS